MLSADHLAGAVVWTKKVQRLPPLSVKFSEHLVPLTDLRVYPDRVVKHAAEAHRPVLLTSRGRGAAVMQSVSDYEQAAEERAFMHAVVAGLVNLDAGREVPLAKAKARFGMPSRMAVARTSFAESTVGDPGGIHEWYAAEGVPEVGHRLVSEILQRVEVFTAHPDIGRIVPEFG